MLWPESKHPAEARLLVARASLRSNHPDFRFARFSTAQCGRDYLISIDSGRSNHEWFARKVSFALQRLAKLHRADFKFMRMAAGCSDFPMESRQGQTYAWLRRLDDMPSVLCGNRYARLEAPKLFAACQDFCETDPSCVYCGCPICEKCRCNSERMNREAELSCSVCAYYNHQGIEFLDD